MTEWFADYFDDGYRDFYKDILTPERTRIEVSFLNTLFSERNVRNILDIPCGYGRHALELAGKGYVVHGIDLYESQLDAARKHAASIKNVSFERADMRNFHAREYDAAINMFSSFGYFSHDDDRNFLQSLVKSVHVNGYVVIDVRNPVRLVHEMKENAFVKERKTATLYEKEIFNPSDSTLIMSYTRNGVEKTAKINIYMPYEYEEMFQKNHCVIERFYGNYNGNSYDENRSWKLIMVARRLK